MTTQLALTVLAFSFIQLLPSTAADLPYECQIEPKTGENFSFAAIQCWLPLEKKELRGILCVVLHPHERDGMLIRDSKAWRLLAEKSGFAFVSVSLVECNDVTRHWFNAEQGSGRALLSGFEQLAEQTGHPEMKKVPIVITGVCAGGQFAYEFASFAPKRTAAFVTIGGGKHNVSLAARSSEVDGLLVICSDRGSAALFNMLSLFGEGEKSKARWALGLETIAPYDEGKCSSLVASYLEDILQGIAFGGAGGRRSMVEKHMSDVLDHWKNEHPEIASGLDLSGDSLNYFPTESVANVWKGGFQAIQLSFPGYPLKPRLSTPNSDIDAGIIKRNDDGSAWVSLEIPVSSVRKDIDNVRLGSTLQSEMEVLSQGEGKWLIKARIDLTSLPSGAVNLDLPIEARCAGNPIIGGLIVRLTANIQGAVKANSTINLGELVAGQPKEFEIDLTARNTGSNLKILRISNHMGSWAEACSETVFADRKRIRFKVDPPYDLAGKAVSGKFEIEAATQYKETLKILLYGHIK
jgi:hypothetical protein